MVTDSFQGWRFRFVFVLLTINTLSGLVHARERLINLLQLSMARLPTEQYDRTILSLLVRCLVIGRGKQ